MKRSLIIVILGLLLFSACRQEDVCLSPTNVLCRGKFYRTISTDTLKDSSLTNGSLYFNSDTGIYIYPLDKTGAFLLPPDITTDSSTFFFIADSTNLAPEARDTFTLFYQRKLKFISVACGFQTEFELSKVMYSGHVIDSIFIPKPEVNSDANQQHLSIILKTP